MAVLLHRIRLLTTALLAALCLVFIAHGPGATLAADQVTVVNIIDTSLWPKPSPDPSGITYWRAHGDLVVVDGEVEETQHWKGANMFESSLTGTQGATYDLTSFTKEPAGIDIDVAPNGDFFFSDDSKQTIWQIDLGPDGIFGSADDTRRSFSTRAFGNGDPEGLSLGMVDGRMKLFTVDGKGREVYISDPGPNGVFDGGGDDVVTHFDVDGRGIRDPEGVDYDPATGHLWVVDRSKIRLYELTITGEILRNINLKTLVNAVNPGDVTLGPHSQNASKQSIYIVDRGIDNNQDPNENDGKIYEIEISEDTIPPNVNNRTPAPDAIDVALSTNVTATFNESVTGVNGSSFTLTPQGGAPVASVVTYDDATRTATLNPNANLSPNTLYTAQLASTIRDLSGNPLPETTWSFTTGSQVSGNLLLNASFEDDANGDGKPDIWSTNKKVTRSSDVVRSGAFAAKFFATDNSSANISQTVNNLTAGTTYQVAGWVNIPAQNDASFTFKLQVRWANASNAIISTKTIKTYTLATNGWDQVTASLVAPAGTTSAQVRLVASSLNGAIYADDIVFEP